MVLAEQVSSARSAVGALALAAVAVSALAFARTPEPEEQFLVNEDAFALDCFHDPATTLGEIVVVGTDEYEPIVETLQELTTPLSHCTGQATHITIYAHVEDGVASAIEVQSEDVWMIDCVQAAVRELRFSAGTPVDVMIPADLVPPLDH